MFRYLIETVRKHLLVKLCLALAAAVGLSFGVDLVYRAMMLRSASDAALEIEARRMSRDLSAVIARPMLDNNQEAVGSAMRLLGAGKGLLAALVVDAEGRDVAVAGTRRFDPGEAVVASRGVDYVDGQGKKIPVGAVVVALSRQGDEPTLGEEGNAAYVRPAIQAIIVLVSALLVVRRVGRPLRDIAQALDKLAHDDTDIRLPGIDRPDEIGRLSMAVQSLRDAIRRRQEAEDEAQTSLAEKSAMLDDAPVGILSERDGIIVACNHRLEQIFGYRPGELLGSHRSALHVCEAAYGQVEGAAEQVQQRGERYSREVELRRKDGAIFWGALTRGDTPQSNIWVYADITQAKKLAAEALAHRLRLEKLVAERSRQLEEAGAIAERTGVAGDGFGDGVFRLENASFDLDGVIRGVAVVFSMQAEEKGLELVVDIDPGLPPLLVGDPLRLGQVLTNLVGNAVKCSEHGEVLLSIRETGRRFDKVQLQFGVRYPGFGMSAGQPSSSLRAADQGGTTSPWRRHGGGLGLAISKRLVEFMGGHLRLESGLGQGGVSQFTVEFEIADTADEKALPDADQLRALAGRRVMVIDDNRSSRLVTGGLLAKLGFVPALFESGRAALTSLVSSGGRSYLFICVDRDMPDLDGLEVAHRLHAHYGRGCPPLLLLAAFSHAVELQGAAHGFAAVVAKPLSLPRLFAQVASMLGVSAGGKTVEPAGPERNLQARLKGKHILLVHGDGLNQEILADFLCEAEMQVRIASDGIEALQAVREKTPACVVMDCQLPIMSAYEATVRLRALGYENLPIIGLAEAPLAEMENYTAAGLNDLVAKPVIRQRLLDTLAKWMAPQPLKFPPSTPASSVGKLLPVGDGEGLPPLPPELDVEAGLRHLRGKTALFLKALRMFRDSCGHEFQVEFRAAVAAGDWQTSERLAHRLKGTAATIGANQVSAAAARLEAAIRSSRYAEAQALLAELTERLRIVIDGLAHIG